MEVKIERYILGGKIKRAYAVDENGKLSGPYEEHYRDGTLKKKCNYKNQILDGPYEEYWQNGKLLKKCTYKDGQLDGPYEEYRINGQIEKRCTYKDGQLDGPYYDSDGTHCTYKDGKIDGRYTVENSTIRIYCSYKNGVLDGPYEKYERHNDEFGNFVRNTITKGVYKNGIFEDDREVDARKKKAKKERKGLNKRLKELDQQMAPTQLRRTVKRKEVSKFRSKYPAKNAGR